MPDVSSDASSLVVVVVTTTFALSLAVYVAANILGGHVNPAVTFGMAVRGHISVPTVLFYYVS
jgi:aquaporin TIP